MTDEEREAALRPARGSGFERPSRKTKSYSLRMDPMQYRALEKVAFEQRRSVANLIGVITADYIAKWRAAKAEKIKSE